VRTRGLGLLIGTRLGQLRASMVGTAGRGDEWAPRERPTGTALREAGTE
jgi:hypothetical protein